MKRKPGYPYLTRVAHHEAGHAVMAALQGVAIMRVTIVPDHGSAGHVLHPDHSAAFLARAETSDLRQSDVQKQIMVALAGPEAERRLTGRRNNWGAGSDRQTAVDLAFRVCPSVNSASAYLRWLGVEVKETTNHHVWYWQAVEAVAAALLKKSTLSGRATRKIVRETQLAGMPSGATLSALAAKGVESEVAFADLPPEIQKGLRGKPSLLKQSNTK